jgi:hypothetical protein
MDKYIEMLNDNNLSPTDEPKTNQSILWDTNEVKDQSVSQLLIKNKVIFATNPSENRVSEDAILLQENGAAILQENGRYILL